MSFFKKIFGSNSDTTPNQQATIKRTIFDFFVLDLKNIPNEIFVEGISETNESGDTITNYRASLNYKECNLFDTVEVIKFSNGSKNVFFKTYNLQRVQMDNIKKLIDELYLLYGNDNQNKGKFNSNDITDYNSSDFYMLFGRSWSEYPKYKYPLTISRDENELSLSIWGIDLKKE